MDRIWAPWRLEYIRSDQDESCFLCRIVGDDSDRENLLLKRGELCGVVMNRYPYNNGHLLVFPYRHIATLSDLNSDEKLEMMNLIDEFLGRLKHSTSPDGFNVGFNLGKVAGAGLESHLHAHIVPRWNGDTNFMPVIGQTKVIPQALTDLYDEIMRE